MNSPTYPFESLDPVAIANLSKFSAATNRPVVADSQVEPLYAYGLMELEEPGTVGNGYDAAQSVQMEDGKFSATDVHAYEEVMTATAAPEETVLFPAPESPKTA